MSNSGGIFQKVSKSSTLTFLIWLGNAKDTLENNYRKPSFSVPGDWPFSQED